MLEVKVWVVVDAGGDYGVGRDEDTALSSYDDDIGGTGTRRMIRVVLQVPEPVVPTLTGTVPAEANEGTLTVG